MTSQHFFSFRIRFTMLASSSAPTPRMSMFSSSPVVTRPSLRGSWPTTPLAGSRTLIRPRSLRSSSTGSAPECTSRTDLLMVRLLIHLLGIVHQWRQAFFVNFRCTLLPSSHILEIRLQCYCHPYSPLKNMTSYTDDPSNQAHIHLILRAFYRRCLLFVCTFDIKIVKPSFLSILK